MLFTVVDVARAYTTVINTTANPDLYAITFTTYVNAGDTISVQRVEEQPTVGGDPQFRGATVSCALQKFHLWTFGSNRTIAERTDAGVTINGTFPATNAYYCKTMSYSFFSSNEPVPESRGVRVTITGKSAAPPVAPPPSHPPRIWSYSGCYASIPAFNLCVGGDNVTTNLEVVSLERVECLNFADYSYCAEMAQNFGYDTFALGGGKSVRPMAACFLCKGCSFAQAPLATNGCTQPVSECFGMCGGENEFYVYEGVVAPTPPSPPLPPPPQPHPPPNPPGAKAIGLAVGVGVGGGAVLGVSLALALYFGVEKKKKTAKAGSRHRVHIAL